MAFTPFSILRSPSVQAILRPQVSTPSPNPELPPARSAFFRHTFPAASLLLSTLEPPTSPPPPLPLSPKPLPPPLPTPPVSLCTDLIPVGLPRDIITTVPLPPAPQLAIVPASPARDTTPSPSPLLTFQSIARSSKPKLLGGAPTPFSSTSEALSTTIHGDTLAAPLVEAVASPLRDSTLQFPYTMATNHREFLNRAGIPVSQFGTKSHPHPVHKTIEINLLHNVWKHHATTPAAVLFMKPSKFPKLQRENPNFVELHNYRLTLKDTVLYPDTSASIPHTHTVFIHDALMYYSPGQILNLFSPAPEIQQLYASLVVPPESSFTDIPLNPSLYLTSMRLTGEPRTYDDNTECNVGVIFLQYALTSEAVMVSGDDSLIDSMPPTRYDWSAVSKLLSLRFKTEVGKHSLFCGYYVGPAGAVRSPTALFVKVPQAIDDDSISDKMASHLTEFSVGHSLGQPMWNLLPPRSVTHRSALFDFFRRAYPPSWKVALRIGNPDPPIFQESQSAISPSPDLQLSHIQAFLTHHPSAPFAQPRPFLSGAGSMDSLSALVPLLTELLSHLNHIESAPSPDPVAPDVLPGGSSAARLVRPPKLQAPARSLTSPALLQGPSIQLPFQFIYYDITGVEKGTNSLDISGKDILLTMMKPYSHARLASLEAVVFPYSASLTYPQTFDAVWSTADAVISGSDIISTYGSQRVTFGGPISSSVQIIIPADLTTLNPILRDPVTYKDTPKLNVAFHRNPDNVALGVSKAVICGSVVIRGVLEVSSVRPSPSEA